MATQMLSTDSYAKTAGTMIVLQALVAALVARHPDRDGIIDSVAGMPEGVRESVRDQAPADTAQFLADMIVGMEDCIANVREQAASIDLVGGGRFIAAAG